MYSSETLQPEHHPYLRTYNIVAGIAGVGMVLGGLYALASCLNYDPGNYAANFTLTTLLILALGLLAVGALLVYIAVRTERITKGFRHWKYGIETKDKVAAHLTLLVGGYVCIGLGIVFLVLLGDFMNPSRE